MKCAKDNDRFRHHQKNVRGMAEWLQLIEVTEIELAPTAVDVGGGLLLLLNDQRKSG